MAVRLTASEPAPKKPAATSKGTLADVIRQTPRGRALRGRFKGAVAEQKAATTPALPSLRAISFDISAPFGPSPWTSRWQEKPDEPQGSPTWPSTLTSRQKVGRRTFPFHRNACAGMSCDGLLWPIAALPFGYLPPKSTDLHRRQHQRCAPRG